MSKELKAPDKVTQKMTRDGAVAENLTTGETTSISERPPEENYSAPAAGAAEKTTQRISTEVSRHFEKGAEKKTLDAAQLKTDVYKRQTVITDIEAKLDAMSVGGLLGLWFQSLFVGLTMNCLLYTSRCV